MKNHENRQQIYTCIKKFYLNDEELEILNNKVSKADTRQGVEYLTEKKTA